MMKICETLGVEESVFQLLIADMIRVVIKRPGEDPVTAVMENTLTAFQRAVDGYIETVSLTEDVIIVCNEEGRLRDMEPNIMGLAGPLVFVGYDGEDGFRALSDFEIDALMDMLGGYEDDPL